MSDKSKPKKSKSSDYVRISVTLPFQLLSIFDEEVKRRGYQRSEAIRATIRNQLETWTGRRL